MKNDATILLNQQISRQQMKLALLRSEEMAYTKQYAITKFRLQTLRREKQKLVKFLVYG